MKINKGKKRLICLHHVPGYMMIDIANAYAEKYDEVILLAGEVRKRRKSLAANVKVVYLKKYNPKSNFSRLYTWSAGFLKALFYIAFKGRGADLFITTNPPLGIFIPFFVKNNFTLLIYDIYPDVLSEYKLLKPTSFVIKRWESANRKIFRKAEKLYTIGVGMKKRISKYIEPDKIQIINCWTDSEFLKPVEKSNNIFIAEQELTNKFLVIYSGNLGVTHDVEVLVDLAQMSTRADLFFLIIGEGDKWKMLEEKIKKNNLANIRLLPWQPVEMLPYSLSAADLAVVTLGKGASLMSVPSKLYDTMAVSSPLLVIAEKESEMASVIKNYNMGACFSAEEKSAMLEYIYKLMDNQELHLSLRANALKASADFTPQNALKFPA